jgi:citronellol/citronellal dehydrogenase
MACIPGRKELSGRGALITGASRGIGACLARELAADGMAVALAARSTRSREKLPGSIPEVAAAIEKSGGRAVPFQVDVRKAAEVSALPGQARDALGRLDLVIHNAGALWWKPALETPAKRLDLVWQVNVRAAFLLAAAAAPLMDRGGHIIFVSPPVDDRPHPGMVAYTVSKYGMTHAALGLSAEWRQRGIAVHALWPATLIESQATINWRLGRREEWRRPEILADAVRVLAGRDPAEGSAGAVLDEDLLRAAGVTDFGRYACVPGSDPPRLEYGDLPRIIAAAQESGG